MFSTKTRGSKILLLN